MRQAKEETMKNRPNNFPVADHTLYSNGNSCRMELYNIGSNLFELYLTDFNSSVPRRFIGTIAEMNERADLFIASKKSLGYQWEIPPFNLHAWIA